MKSSVFTLALCASLAAVGCDKSEPAPSKDKPASGTTPGAAGTPHPALNDPSLATETAPAEFKARFATTKGDFVIEVYRDWAPHGADRFYNLVRIGYFQDIALFRAVQGFVVQFGIHGTPAIAQKWSRSNIPADLEVKQPNVPGTLTFAMAGKPTTRSTQLFINLGDNRRLDGMGFAPIGKVVEGMDVVQAFYTGYGERVTKEQGNITMQGNAFLKQNYPELDYILGATIVP